jgi:hypothetical protein
MSANVLMISEQSFKDFTVASANIDLKNVTQVIKMTQDRYIHPICGTALYNKILELIVAGTIGDAGNAVYKTLLDSYITDTLFNYVLGELPMALQYKFVNKGVVKRKSLRILKSLPLQNCSLSVNITRDMLSGMRKELSTT